MRSMMMGEAGNRVESDERRRFEIAYRARNCDRVIERAQQMAQVEPVTLGDAIRISSLLADTKHAEADAWRARLYARLVLSKRTDLDEADTILGYVQRFDEEDRQALRILAR